MKEINLPYTGIADSDQVEVIVRNCSKNKEWLYRIECLKLDNEIKKENNKSSRIERLLSYIRSYDHCWELLNIFNTENPEGYIHLLYRKQN
jgi:phosphomevalonate kinase